MALVFCTVILEIGVTPGILSSNITLIVIGSVFHIFRSMTVGPCKVLSMELL